MLLSYRFQARERAAAEKVPATFTLSDEPTLNSLHPNCAGRSGEAMEPVFSQHLGVILFGGWNPHDFRAGLCLCQLACCYSSRLHGTEKPPKGGFLP